MTRGWLYASLVEALKNASTYANYALFGTSLEAMYGEHLEPLRELRRDGPGPENVMGLAGGWRLDRATNLPRQANGDVETEY